jgi:hypothetical protein
MLRQWVYADWVRLEIETSNPSKSANLAGISKYPRHQADEIFECGLNEQPLRIAVAYREFPESRAVVVCLRPKWFMGTFGFTGP